MLLKRNVYLFGFDITIDEVKHCAKMVDYKLSEWYGYEYKDDKIIGLVSRDLSSEELEMLGICYKFHLNKL